MNLGTNRARQPPSLISAHQDRVALERAVASARRAFDDGRWRNLAPLDKERRLRRLSELVADHGDVFSDIDVLDAGLLKSYTGFIVQATVDALDYYAGRVPAVADVQ